MRPEMIEETALLRRHWQVEEAPDDLAARIVAHATRLPQHQPWRLRLGAFVRSFTGVWNVALIPATAVAALLIVGAFDSQMKTSFEDDVYLDAMIADSMGMSVSEL